MDNYSIKEKSLEILESNIWDVNESNNQTFLIKKCHQLRKKRLGEFSIEDFRIMIGQDISLNFLTPLVLDILSTNLFAEGDYYKGDLLQSLLNIKTEFWKDNPKYWHQLDEMLEKNRIEIIELKIDTFKFDSIKL